MYSYSMAAFQQCCVCAFVWVCSPDSERGGADSASHLTLYVICSWGEQNVEAFTISSCICMLSDKQMCRPWLLHNIMREDFLFFLEQQRQHKKKEVSVKGLSRCYREDEDRQGHPGGKCEDCGAWFKKHTGLREMKLLCVFLTEWM